MEVTRLGLDIADQLQQPRGRLAESVAEMCLNHGVVELIITTHQAQISISRDEIPALKTVEAKRTRGSVRQSQERHPSFPLQVDNAVSQSKIEAVHSSEFVAQQGEILAGLGRPRVGRMYTVVGTLRAPDSRGNVVPHSSGQFRTQSGKTYVARGVDWDRAPATDDPVVIRAEIAGRDGEYTVLNVQDVFQPEEP